MGCRHRAQMGGSVDQFLHFRLGFLVSLLPLGVLQFITDSRLVDIGDVRTKEFVLSAQLVHLVFQLAATLLHAIKQTVRDTVLHPVELVLVGSVSQVHVPVGFPYQLFLVQFLYPFPFFLHLLHFLPLCLLGGNTCLLYTSDAADE